MIEFDNVKKMYNDGTLAVSDYSITINEGELVTLIGPSGCGKTTVLKMLNRLIEPTEGAIYINGTEINKYNIHELRWNIGYVLQEIALFPHLTIEENISIVPEMKKWNRETIRKRTHDLLSMVGLEPSTFRKRMPSELSGGQQQRIGVVRALAADPDIILMDEPFSALDPISREQLQKDIRKLQREIKKTIVFVTHDMDEAIALGDRVCLMKKGKIVQYDTPPRLMMHPKDQFVKDFIGERKSPWQTSVEMVANQSGDHVISVKKAENVFPTAGKFILKDGQNRYAGAIDNGRSIQLKTINHDVPLYKATEMLQENDQQLLPVLKKQRLVGVLYYKSIVDFLKRQTKANNEETMYE
ncbi:MAG TPA: ABC transporter ATP-binding protein [Virgibacillus sp.]|nr:ABC transporter ATP-binding protein [Virgibacillus sp.]HLR66246.1 ABC transporter ATP-binding protein [Virgibacillus sp.]